MKIFQFEQPITDAIRARFVKIFNEDYPNAVKRNLFIAHEPPAGEIFSYNDVKTLDGFTIDGVIAVYSENIDPVQASSSQTGEQETSSFVHIDCYGYGDVFFEGSSPQKSSITAQKRAQVLTSIAYEAVMDATEFGDTFGTDIVIGEKVFAGVEKGPVLGSEQTNRTICFYRLKFQIRLEEDIPTEALGLAYDGGNITQETENP